MFASLDEVYGKDFGQIAPNLGYSGPQAIPYQMPQEDVRIESFEAPKLAPKLNCQEYQQHVSECLYCQRNTFSWFWILLLVIVVIVVLIEAANWYQHWKLPNYAFPIR